MTAAYEDRSGALPEISRIVAADDIGAKGSTIVVEATADECVALAKRFDLVAVHRLAARARLRRRMARDGSGAALSISFDMDAQVVQRCVVSLDPVTAQIQETGLVVEYRLSGDPDPATEIDITLEAVDPPDILVDGRLDLGEVVVEHLALALDPYPRAEGVEPERTDRSSDAETAAEKEHPFAALRGWSDRAKSNKG